MADITNEQVFPGYELVPAAGTVTAQSICIPLAALTELSAIEAAETTGKGAQLIRAIDVAIHEAISGLATNARPTNMTSVVSTEQTGTLTRVRTFLRSYNEAAPANSFDLVAE